MRNKKRKVYAKIPREPALHNGAALCMQIHSELTLLQTNRQKHLHLRRSISEGFRRRLINIRFQLQKQIKHARGHVTFRGKICKWRRCISVAQVTGLVHVFLILQYKNIMMFFCTQVHISLVYKNNLFQCKSFNTYSSIRMQCI